MKRVNIIIGFHRTIPGNLIEYLKKEGWGKRYQTYRVPDVFVTDEVCLESYALETLTDLYAFPWGSQDVYEFLENTDPSKIRCRVYISIPGNAALATLVCLGLCESFKGLDTVEDIFIAPTRLRVDKSAAEMVGEPISITGFLTKWVH